MSLSLGEGLKRGPGALADNDPSSGLVSGSFYPTDINSLVAGYDAQREELVTITGSGISTLESIKGSFDMVQTTDSNRPPYVTAADGFKAFECQNEYLTISQALLDIEAGDFDVWYVTESFNRQCGVFQNTGTSAELRLALSSAGNTQVIWVDNLGTAQINPSSNPGSGGLYIRRTYRTSGVGGVETVGVANPNQATIPAATYTCNQTSIGQGTIGSFFFEDIRGAYFFDSFLGTSGSTDYDNMKAFCASNHNATIS